MPLYEYRCETCGTHKDEFQSIADHDKGPPCCGEPMRQVIRIGAVHPDFEPYYDPNLGEGAYVKSKQHRRKLMRQHGVSEAYGKGWQ